MTDASVAALDVVCSSASLIAALYSIVHCCEVNVSPGWLGAGAEGSCWQEQQGPAGEGEGASEGSQGRQGEHSV